MKEKYYYSPSVNAFHPNSLILEYKDAESLPTDIIEVSDEVFREYTQQKKGFIRIAGSDGFPIWITEPPSTYHLYEGGAWVITEEKKAELNDQVKQLRINELKHTIQKLENDLVVAHLRGKDISTILKDLDDLEKELAEYD